MDPEEPRFGATKLERFFGGSLSGEKVTCGSSPGSVGESSSASPRPTRPPESESPLFSFDPGPRLSRMDAFLLLLLLRPSTAAMPSHCDPRVPPGVPGRLPGRLTLGGRLPTLVRERACEPLLPEIPSSLRSVSAVASSSIADQPSCVPRSRECATALDAFSGEAAAWAAAVGWRRKCWIEDDDGEGGRCEKSVPVARFEWVLSPAWLEDDELRECFVVVARALDPRLRAATLSLRASLALSREAVVEILPPMLRCLRVESRSSLTLSFNGADEGKPLRLDAAALDESVSISSDGLLLERCGVTADTRREGGLAGVTNGSEEGTTGGEPRG